MATIIQDEARATMARAQAKLERLQTIEPYLIDLSLRENAFGSRIGQTLQDKLAILPTLRQFGFQNILLGTLDYTISEELEVDDDFMMYLRDNHIDTTGGFAFTDIGRVIPGGDFVPSASMLKLRNYKVPNTLHEIYLSPDGMTSAGYDFATVMESLPASVAWLNANVVGDSGGRPRILINIVDGCDAFSQNYEQTCQLLALLATLPIQGLSLEDDRGTYFPFQVGSYVSVARTYLPVPMKILVHMHAGAGFENASLIEALVEGADGVWGGLPKRAAIIGHASLGELIANLVRAGNPSMQAAYEVKTLLPLATSLQVLDDEQAIPEDLPILGSNAYRMTLDFFEQKAGRPMDLPPEVIGGTYGYRICPLGSNAPVLAGRLAEVSGYPAQAFATGQSAVLIEMIKRMRRELRAGIRIVYDEPTQLLDLYSRAGGAMPPTAI